MEIILRERFDSSQQGVCILELLRSRIPMSTRWNDKQYLVAHCYCQPQSTGHVVLGLLLRCQRFSPYGHVEQKVLTFQVFELDSAQYQIRCNRLIDNCVCGNRALWYLTWQFT